ncbi:MAG: GTP-binding protein [Breznakibacter sp.]
MNNKIPVTIITGFLGAGKTTLLNNLIRKHPEKRFAIIENEFGEIGIDGGLIVDVDDNVFELANGCICCSLNDDFMRTVRNLLDVRHKFGHVLVETTGVADPDTIVGAFLSTEAVQRDFVLDSVVCLVDAINLEDLMDSQPEVRKQIALADTVLVNKTDCVNPQYAAQLLQWVGMCNPSARVIAVSHADISDIDILESFAFSGRGVETSTMHFRSVTMLRGANTPQSLLMKSGKAHRHDIVSEGFVVPGSFDRNKFGFWMQNFMCYNADTLFRIKGVISFNGIAERFVFQAVRTTYMFEVGTCWDDDEPRFSKLVFIGRHLDRDNLEDNLYQLLAEN